jgi:hypothetical protein
VIKNNNNLERKDNQMKKIKRIVMKKINRSKRRERGLNKLDLNQNILLILKKEFFISII